jgi:hypothetical protein
MVAEVGQQENGNRSDSTTGLNKRVQRTREKDGANSLRIVHGSQGGPAG